MIKYLSKYGTINNFPLIALIGVILGLAAASAFPPYNLWILGLVGIVIILSIIGKLSGTNQFTLIFIYFFTGRAIILKDAYYMLHNKLINPGVMTSLYFVSLILRYLLWGSLLLIIAIPLGIFLKKRLSIRNFELVFWPIILVIFEYLIEVQISLGSHIPLVNWSQWRTLASYFGHYGTLVIFYALASVVAYILFNRSYKGFVILIIGLLTAGGISQIIQKNRGELKTLKEIPVIAITKSFIPDENRERTEQNLKEIIQSAKKVAAENLKPDEYPLYLWYEDFFARIDNNPDYFENFKKYIAEELPGVHGIGISKIHNLGIYVKETSKYDFIDFKTGEIQSYGKHHGVTIDEDRSVIPWLSNDKIHFPLELEPSDSPVVIQIPQRKISVAVLLCNEIEMTKEIVSNSEFKNADIFLNPSFIPTNFPNSFSQLMDLHVRWISAIYGKPVIHLTPGDAVLRANNGVSTRLKKNEDGIYYFRL